MNIPAFITRCDRFCEAAGQSRTWLSKKLFSDTYRLQELADGAADVGVKRLERALAELEEMETALMQAAGKAAA